MKKREHKKDFRHGIMTKSALGEKYKIIKKGFKEIDNFLNVVFRKGRDKDVKGSKYNLLNDFMLDEEYKKMMEKFRKVINSLNIELTSDEELKKLEESIEKTKYLVTDILNKAYRKSNEGDAESQYLLGILYYEGNDILSVPIMHEGAYRFLKLASDQGHEAAAEHLKNQVHISDDKKYIQSFAKQGNVKAQVMLDSRGSLQDLAKSFKEFSDQGNPWAQENLASIYEHGRHGVIQTYEKALKYYQLASVQRGSGYNPEKALEKCSKMRKKIEEQKNHNKKYGSGREIVSLKTRELIKASKIKVPEKRRSSLLGTVSREPLEPRKSKLSGRRFKGQVRTTPTKPLEPRKIKIPEKRRSRLVGTVSRKPLEPRKSKLSGRRRSSLVGTVSRGPLQDLAKSFKELSNQGNPWAQESLASIYEYGRHGIIQTYEKALKYYQLSSVQRGSGYNPEKALEKCSEMRKKIEEQKNHNKKYGSGREIVSLKTRELIKASKIKVPEKRRSSLVGTVPTKPLEPRKIKVPEKRRSSLVGTVSREPLEPRKSKLSRRRFKGQVRTAPTKPLEPREEGASRSSILETREKRITTGNNLFKKLCKPNVKPRLPESQRKSKSPRGRGKNYTRATTFKFGH